MSNYFTTGDGTQIYLEDRGNGQLVVLSHGWPLTADAWDDQMVFLGNEMDKDLVDADLLSYFES